MTPPITPDTERLAEIAERAKNATEGPWRWADWTADFGTRENPNYMWTLETSDDPPEPQIALKENCGPIQVLCIEDGDILDRDKIFIAHSRQDIPFLLQTIQALQEDNQILKEAVALMPDLSVLMSERTLLTAALEKARLSQRATVKEAFDRLNSMLTHIPLAEEEAVLSTYPQ